MPVSDYSDLFESAGRQYNVDPRLLAAMASVESSGNPRAVSPQGAEGLMQIMPDTANQQLGGIDPFDPKQAVSGAAQLMARYLDTYKNPVTALMAYHGGQDTSIWGPKTAAYPGLITAAYGKMPARSAPQIVAQAAPAPADAFSAAFNAGGDADVPGGHSPSVAAALARAATAVTQAPANDAFSAAFTPPVEPPVAADEQRPASEYKTVPIHPAPDGNGMTNLSDADFADLHRKLGAQVASPPAPAAAITVTPQTTPQAPAPNAPVMMPLTPMDPMTGAAMAQTDTGLSSPLAVAGNPSSTPEQTASITAALGNALTAINGVLGSVQHGLSMGLDRPLDRLAARLAGTSATENAAEQQQQTFETAHPFVSGAATAAGALPAYMMGEGALMNAGMVGAGGLTGALTTGARNALLGGTSAFGLANGGLDDRLNAAGSGAAIGAVAPPLVRGLIGAAGKIVGPVASRVLPDRTALSKVSQAIERDQMTPLDVANSLTRLGPNAALVDAGGANLRGLGETVAIMPGEPAQQADSFLEGRMAGQASRLNDAVKAATGSSGDYHAALDKLATDRAAAAAPEYAKAFARPVTMPEVRPIQRFIQDPIGQEALQKGMRVIQLEDLASGKLFEPAKYGVVKGTSGAWIMDPDTLAGNKAPGMRLLDAVKRGYDEIVEGFRDPTSGRLNLNQYGRAVNSVRAAYVGALRSLSPEYAKALDTWAGPSRAMDALSMGRDVLTVDPEVTAKTIAGLSPSEKQFFQAGVARALRDRIEATPDNADATRRIFGNNLIRDKIESGFADPKAFDEFQTSMEREATFAKTRNAVLKGSQTARRLAGQNDLEVNIAEPLLHAASGNFGHAVMSGIRQGINALQRPSSAQATRLGNILFSPANASSALNALINRPAPVVRPLLGPLSVLGGNQLMDARYRTAAAH